MTNLCLLSSTHIVQWRFKIESQSKGTLSFEKFRLVIISNFLAEHDIGGSNRQVGGIVLFDVQARSPRVWDQQIERFSIAEMSS